MSQPCGSGAYASKPYAPYETGGGAVHGALAELEARAAALEHENQRLRTLRSSAERDGASAAAAIDELRRVGPTGPAPAGPLEALALTGGDAARRAVDDSARELDHLARSLASEHQRLNDVRAKGAGIRSALANVEAAVAAERRRTMRAGHEREAQVATFAAECERERAELESLHEALAHASVARDADERACRALQDLLQPLLVGNDALAARVLALATEDTADSSPPPDLPTPGTEPYSAHGLAAAGPLRSYAGGGRAAQTAPHTPHYSGTHAAPSQPETAGVSASDARAGSAERGYGWDAAVRGWNTPAPAYAPAPRTPAFGTSQRTRRDEGAYAGTGRGAAGTHSATPMHSRYSAAPLAAHTAGREEQSRVRDEAQVSSAAFAQAEARHWNSVAARAEARVRESLSSQPRGAAPAAPLDGTGASWLHGDDYARPGTRAREAAGAADSDTDSLEGDFAFDALTGAATARRARPASAVWSAPIRSCASPVRARSPALSRGPSPRRLSAGLALSALSYGRLGSGGRALLTGERPPWVPPPAKTTPGIDASAHAWGSRGIVGNIL